MAGIGTAMAVTPPRTADEVRRAGDSDEARAMDATRKTGATSLPRYSRGSGDVSFEIHLRSIARKASRIMIRF
jgi:hypothetical protein